MNLSIIIPSYNTKDLLDRCLSSVFRSLSKSDLSYEVMVVDNNSSDGTQEMVSKKYPQVLKLFNKENLGYGKANNLGLKKARGECILLLNSDCKVLDEALDQLYKFSKSHPSSFIGAKLLNEDTSPQPSCGPFYTLPVVFTMLFLKGDIFHITRSSPDAIQTVDWVSGACIIAPKTLLDLLGGFDEEIFMYMEEIDLLYRAKQKGYTTIFYPEARLIHSGAASSRNKREPVVNIYKGLSFFYKKHYSSTQHAILNVLLRLKAWSVIIICVIIGNKELKDLYAKALAVLS